jgi:hypothetical protein
VKIAMNILYSENTIVNHIMHKIPIDDNFVNKKHLILKKNKVDISLKDLNNEFSILLNKDNIELLYHNVTTTISTSIKNLSIEMLCKKENGISKPWCDKECKIKINSGGF